MALKPVVLLAAHVGDGGVVRRGLKQVCKFTATAPSNSSTTHAVAVFAWVSQLKLCRESLSRDLERLSQSSVLGIDDDRLVTLVGSLTPIKTSNIHEQLLFLR